MGECLGKVLDTEQVHKDDLTSVRQMFLCLAQVSSFLVESQSPFAVSRVWAAHAEIAVYYFELVVIQTEFKSSPSNQFPSDHSETASFTFVSVYLGFQVGFLTSLSLSTPGHILIHTFFPSTYPALHPASRDGLTSRAELF